MTTLAAWWMYNQYVEFEEYAADRRQLVEQRLGELLPREGERPARLHQAMRYSVLNGGKRFRPLLCIAAAEAMGGTPEQALDAACAIEFIHCFSLIHDDLPALDNDDLRRGKPACHVAFGEPIAILAGDALFALAFEVMATLPCPASRQEEWVASPVHILAVASGTRGMVGGQTVDVESEHIDADIETVRWIHARKTGALIAASCEIGALLAGGSEDQVAACRRCGENIGLAFQITDDVLNEVGAEANLGKRTQTDRERKKATFPAVTGLDDSQRLAQEAYRAALKEAGGFGEPGVGLVALSRYAADRDR